MHSRFLTFPAIEKHGVIGDRRTGALVAADGTLDWLCAPNFDGPPIFGALLDPELGDFCRFGPETPSLGQQRYVKDTAALTTAWPDDGIKLTDVMAWPEAKRTAPTDGQRVIIRRLRITRETAVVLALQPRRNFDAPASAVHPAQDGALFQFPDGTFGSWASFPLEKDSLGASARLRGRAGEEHWVVLGWNVQPEEWTPELAAQVSGTAQSYWRDWSSGLQIRNSGDRTEALRRSALTVQLLSHAHTIRQLRPLPLRCPNGSAATATTTTATPGCAMPRSPSRSSRAWQKRRSAALSGLALSFALDHGGAAAGLLPARWQPASRAGGNRGRARLSRQPSGPARQSRRQTNSIGRDGLLCGLRAHLRRSRRRMAGGVLADVETRGGIHGGALAGEGQRRLGAPAKGALRRQPGDELGLPSRPFWRWIEYSRLILQRALHIAEKTGHAAETEGWATTAAAIHSEVLEKGWCEKKKAFRQRYDSDALDAAALLIPLMEFLPIDHPRVVSTIAAREDELIVHGLMHRFDPTQTLGAKQLPIGEFEGAFLPCVFWHAHTLALADRADEAEAILARCEAIAGAPGLFAEEVDAKNETFLGNTPLLFSHVEYVRAVVALNQARSRAPQPQHAKIHEFA